jgi:hypothetical protein
MPRGSQPLVQGAQVSAINSSHHRPSHQSLFILLQLSRNIFHFSLSPFHRSNTTKITKNSQEYSRTHLNIHPTTITKSSSSITQRSQSKLTQHYSANPRTNSRNTTHASSKKRIQAQLITRLQRVCKVLRDSVRIVIIEPNSLQSELRFTTKAAKTERSQRRREEERSK